MSENSKTIKRNFVCPKNVSRYLFCAICNEIFNSPVRIKECGHTFCRKCIKNWGKLHASCPFCRTAFNPKNLKKDIIAHNIINDLDVFCEYKNCPWKGVLRQLRKHIKTCNFKPSSISDAIKNASVSAVAPQTAAIIDFFARPKIFIKNTATTNCNVEFIIPVSSLSDIFRNTSN